MKTLLLLGLSTLFFTACTSQETALKTELEEANYCETAEDCVLIGSKCPFGCYIYVNTAEADRLETAVEAYDSDCVYSCIASEGVACEDNVCVALTEQPTL